MGLHTLYFLSGCFVSPIREAVCSCENPAWCDERATTEESVLVKESSDPWVRLYGCEGTTHNFMHPLLRPLATRQLCRDTHDESVSDNEGITRWHWENSVFKQHILPVSTADGGFVVGVEPVWDQEKHINGKIQIKHTVHQWFKNLQSNLTFGNVAELSHNPPPFSDTAPRHRHLIRVPSTWNNIKHMM